ncbi:unnamed protein product, partial [Ectocarpus fasciculatus]
MFNRLLIATKCLACHEVVRVGSFVLPLFVLLSIPIISLSFPTRTQQPPYLGGVNPSRRRSFCTALAAAAMDRQGDCKPGDGAEEEAPRA